MRTDVIRTALATPSNIDEYSRHFGALPRFGCGPRCRRCLRLGCSRGTAITAQRGCCLSAVSDRIVSSACRDRTRRRSLLRTPDAEVRSYTDLRFTRVSKVLADISQGNEEFARRKGLDAWDYFVALRRARTQGLVYRAPSVARRSRVSYCTNTPRSSHDR